MVVLLFLGDWAHGCFWEEIRDDALIGRGFRAGGSRRRSWVGMIVLSQEASRGGGEIGWYGEFNYGILEFLKIGDVRSIIQ